MTRSSLFALVALLGPALAGCGDDELAVRLAAARSGDTITASGSHSGPLRVPAGVTLIGDGLTVEASGGAPVIEVETVAGVVTRVEAVRIRSTADAALVVRGGGSFIGKRLELTCDRGIGIAAEGVAELQLEETTVQGSVTKASLADLSYPLSAAQSPVIGLALSKVASVRLTRVKVSGFGGFGAALIGSNVTWTGEGGATQNAGVGMIADGGKLTLEGGVAVRETWAGQRGLAIFSYGLVLTGGVEASSRDLTVEGGGGYGILQEGARATHSGLQVKGNAEVGVWLQRTPRTGAAAILAIDGASTIAGNRGGGLFVLESGGVQLQGVTISGTQKKPVMVGTSGSLEMGDGLQLSALTQEASLKQVSLVDNARVGVLLSGTPPPGGVILSDVKISGIGQYGLIPENDFTPDGNWQVVRDARLEQADKTVPGTLGVAKPMGALPSLAPVKSRGLLGTGGVVHGGVQIGKDGLQSP